MSFLKDKVVLVTGAGGSIGSELCFEILSHDPKQLIAFDNSELALYNLSKEMTGVKLVLGDITNDEDIRMLFYTHRIDAVYHAAAYKHVTFCEQNMRVAHRVNVEGTARMARAARSYDVPTFVLISTDKAVRPTSVMGWTKQAAENIVTSLGYSVIRLGNVYGSSGSVVPLWHEQIQCGAPVTITDLEATRYFLGAGKAAALIIRASAIAQPGEVYVPDMGAPVSIVDLAKSLGATRFEIVGLRPGEKLHEELFVGERACTNDVYIWRDSL